MEITFREFTRNHPPPKVTYESITRIIKLGQFMQEELDSVLRKMKTRKAAGLDEIPSEIWKTRPSDNILLWHCNAVYNQNTIDRWTKGCIFPFLKKRDLGLAENYRGINPYIHSGQDIQCSTTQPHRTHRTEKILRKKQNGFRRNKSMMSQILTIRWILEGVRAKNLEAAILFVDFSKAFHSIYRGKMEKILLANGRPK